MNDNYSYAELLVTTSNVNLIRTHDDHSSSTHAFRPKMPLVHDQSPPKSEWKSALAPIGTFIFGAALAFGHHVFNAWADDRPVAKIIVPQDWVTRIGVGFSFGFKTALGATMAFVLLQCLWLSVRRRRFTIHEIDTLYHIERCNQLYRTLPQALFSSPIIVLFSILTLLLPLSGVFAPSSLTVSTKNYTDVAGPCTIPTGNLSNIEQGSFYIPGIGGYWSGVTATVTTLITQWFVEQRIPDLPQACGPNCLYRVSVPSFVIQCQPNPASLPYGQGGLSQDAASLRATTLWNGTMDPDSKWSFYIAWQSNGLNGTSGNASCSPFQAQYDVEVRMKAGIQSITTNVILVTSPIPDVTNWTTVTLAHAHGYNTSLWMQLASLAYATRALFLGDAVISGRTFSLGLNPGPVSPPITDNTQASQASFLNIPVGANKSEFVWGDVLKGIEDMSHNVTAALLTLKLGSMSAECLFDQQILVYRYNPFALWTPYGTALCVTLLSLVVAIIILAKYNTGHITTSFSDTITATRRVEGVSAGGRLRLRAVRGGQHEYFVE